MKLNKTFGRIATTLVATAMLASVAVVPAFATSVTGDGTKKIAEVGISKTLYLPTGTDVPDVEYEFNIVGATASASDVATGTQGIENAPVTLEVKSGDGTYYDVGSYDFTSYAGQPTVMAGNTGVSYVEVPVTLTLPEITFSDAGVYKYNVTETIKVNGTEVTVETDTENHYVFGQQLNLYLYVNRVGTEEPYEYQVVGAVLTDAAGTKTEDIYNYYDVTPGTGGGDPTANLGSLSITKTVTGAMGDQHEDFDFTISGITDGTYNIVYTGNTGSSRDTDVNVVDGTATLPVKHGETVTIYGITPAKDVTVSENATTLEDEGYTVTATSVNGEALGTPSSIATVDVVASETATTAFTNNREAVSPTGLVMDIAPYALLVVVAAAGCFVFLRKRRED